MELLKIVTLIETSDWIPLAAPPSIFHEITVPGDGDDEADMAQQAGRQAGTYAYG